jgi:hypothetical protein
MQSAGSTPGRHAEVELDAMLSGVPPTNNHVESARIVQSEGQ